MDQFLPEIIAWAQEQEDIRAVILVGSRARQYPPADEWSDLDLEFYSTEFTSYFENLPPLERFGQLWVNVPFVRGDQRPEYLVLYDQAFKLDFSFLPVSDLQKMVETQHLHKVYTRGYRILLDKDGLTTNLPPATGEVIRKPPESAEFRREVNFFWYGAVYVAKQIRRRQLWTVQYRDWTMKQHLLKMLEWHATMHNLAIDTWHEGRFVLDWTDPESAAALRECFGHFDIVDSWNALLVTNRLFSRLAQEVAEHYHFAYPDKLESSALAFVSQLHEEDPL